MNVPFVLKDKKPKEQEKRGDFLHRPFSKKLDKNLPSHKQPSPSLITQIQNTKALLKDRKASKSGFPDKGGSAPLSRSAGGCVGSEQRWLCLWKGTIGTSKAKGLRPSSGVYYLCRI